MLWLNMMEVYCLFSYKLINYSTDAVMVLTYIYVYVSQITHYYMSYTVYSCS